MRSVLVALVAVSFLSGTASALDIQKSGPEIFPSKQELNAYMGFQAGYGGQVGNPSGFKLTVDYGYKFRPLVWFDLQLSNVFGFGGSSGPCQQVANGYSDCFYNGGWAVEIAGGAKIKLPIQRVPIVVEIPLLAGVSVLYNRECGDSGASPMLKPGVSAKYFITKRVGLGLMMDTAFGPGFHGSSKCHGSSYTDFYGYFDFLAGAEFVL